MVALTREGIAHSVVRSWSVGQRKKGIEPGDTFYLFRQGDHGRGLVARGEVDSEIFAEDHWDGTQRSADFVGVIWLEALPLSQRVDVEELVRRIPDYGWATVFGSGRDLTKHEKALNALWLEHLQAAGIGPLSRENFDEELGVEESLEAEDIADAILELSEAALAQLAEESSEQTLLGYFEVVLLDEDDDYPEYQDKADLERQFVEGVLEFQAEIAEMELALLPEDNPRELELGVQQLGLADQSQHAALQDAAMKAVQEFFAQQELTTQDVSGEAKGWNITVTAEDEEMHVAVKGCLGEEPEFILSANEYNASRRDEDWTLIAVMNALTDTPILVEIPQEALDENREEIGYKVRLAPVEPDDQDAN